MHKWLNEGDIHTTYFHDEKYGHAVEGAASVLDTCQSHTYHKHAKNNVGHGTRRVQ